MSENTIAAPNNLQSLAETLKSARHFKGLSRAELSRRTGVAANSIAKYEGVGAAQLPPLPKLAVIAAHLDIDGRYILASCVEDEALKKRLCEVNAVSDMEGAVENGLRKGLLETFMDDAKRNEFISSVASAIEANQKKEGEY